MYKQEPYTYQGSFLLLSYINSPMERSQFQLGCLVLITFENQTALVPQYESRL